MVHKKVKSSYSLWRLSRLVSSCNCSDLVRSPTERAESQVRSETSTIHCPYAKSVTSQHGRIRAVRYLPTKYPPRITGESVLKSYLSSSISTFIPCNFVRACHAITIFSANHEKLLFFFYGTEKDTFSQMRERRLRTAPSRRCQCLRTGVLRKRQPPCPMGSIRGQGVSSCRL